MSKYTTLSTMPSLFDGRIDPDGGFLCMTSHWRPDPDADDPERPGQKLTMNSYIPLHPSEDCLCGSGKRYGKCCQPKRLWHPVCPNPDGEKYRLIQPQTAKFHSINGEKIREHLMANPRLRCTDTSQDSAFWILHGHPPIEDQYGFLCFGDFELKHNRTLLVSAMSDLRMEILLDLLLENAPIGLGKPRISRGSVYVIDKNTGKTRAVQR